MKKTEEEKVRSPAVTTAAAAGKGGRAGVGRKKESARKKSGGRTVRHEKGRAESEGDARQAIGARRTLSPKKETGKTKKKADAFSGRENGKQLSSQRPERRESHPGRRQPVTEKMPATELPEEYGENEFFLIPVEPRVVYASWEVTRDAMPAGKEGLEVRFLEVMPGQNGESNARPFLDIAIPDRVGDGFFHLGIQGREIIAEIGCREADGHFIAMLRSRRVLIPGSLGEEVGQSAGEARIHSYGSRPPGR